MLKQLPVVKLRPHPWGQHMEDCPRPLLPSYDGRTQAEQEQVRKQKVMQANDHIGN